MRVIQRNRLLGISREVSIVCNLILVTSQAMSETRNLDLQEKVLGLTDRLRGLTIWLIVLTAALLVLGVATLWVTLANTLTVFVKVNQTSHPHRQLAPQHHGRHQPQVGNAFAWPRSECSDPADSVTSLDETEHAPTKGHVAHSGLRAL